MHIAYQRMVNGLLRAAKHSGNGIDGKASLEHSNRSVSLIFRQRGAFLSTDEIKIFFYFTVCQAQVFICKFPKSLIKVGCDEQVKIQLNSVYSDTGVPNY